MWGLRIALRVVQVGDRIEVLEDRVDEDAGQGTERLIAARLPADVKVEAR